MFSDYNLTLTNVSTAERNAQLKLIPVYQKRREVTKGIANFWPIALMNHPVFSVHAQHNADQLALSYLEDVWVERDPKEPRCYTIEFVGARRQLLRCATRIHARWVSTSKKTASSRTKF